MNFDDDFHLGHPIPYAPCMEYESQHLPKQNHPNVGTYTIHGAYDSFQKWGYPQIIHADGSSTVNHPAIGVPPFMETSNIVMISLGNPLGNLPKLARPPEESISKSFARCPKCSCHSFQVNAQAMKAGQRSWRKCWKRKYQNSWKDDGTLWKMVVMENVFQHINLATNSRTQWVCMSKPSVTGKGLGHPNYTFVDASMFQHHECAGSLWDIHSYHPSRCRQIARAQLSPRCCRLFYKKLVGG